MRDHVARQHAFVADIETVRAINVALYLAHDHNFFCGNVRSDVSAAADGNAIVGKADAAFDAAINEERFRASQFTFDDERTSDVGLIHG